MCSAGEGLCECVSVLVLGEMYSMYTVRVACVSVHVLGKWTKCAQQRVVRFHGRCVLFSAGAGMLVFVCLFAQVLS